jgi:ATP-dependent DNA helicase RecQ
MLSCAYRTGQHFGAMHLIDVLVGRMSERVRQFGHDKLSVFGVGRELNEKQWRAVLRQLVAMGHLRADSEAFGALKLTDSARGVLKGETEVMLREAAASSAQPRRPRQVAAWRRPRQAARAAPPIRPCTPRCRLASGGAAAWRRPTWCCTIPPSTARRVRQRRLANFGIAGSATRLEHYGDSWSALVKASRAEA